MDVLGPCEPVDRRSQPWGDNDSDPHPLSPPRQCLFLRSRVKPCTQGASQQLSPTLQAAPLTHYFFLLANTAGRCKK